MLTFAMFPIVLFFCGAILVTGAPLSVTLSEYYKNRGRHSVRCPESRATADIVIDNKFALQTAVRGQEQSRVASCSRWPGEGNCGQTCLVQLDPSPENLGRLLSKWTEGQSCAICARAITGDDWKQSRLAVLNQANELFELRDLPAEDLQAALEYTRPLCWRCHKSESERQAAAPRHQEVASLA